MGATLVNISTFPLTPKEQKPTFCQESRGEFEVGDRDEGEDWDEDQEVDLVW